ncbi:MAG: hypothetical protein ACK4J0_01860 [Candidatus Anstonellaceae archaeon]
MSLNMENFTNYWGKASGQITPYKSTQQKNYNKIFFNKLIDTEKNIEKTRIATKEDILKIEKISKGLQENYLE